MTQFGRAPGRTTFGQRQGGVKRGRINGPSASGRGELSAQAKAFLTSQRSPKSGGGTGGLGNLGASPAATSTMQSGAGHFGGKPVGGRRLFSYLIDSIAFSAIWFLVLAPLFATFGFGGQNSFSLPDPELVVQGEMVTYNPEDLTLASLGLGMLVFQYIGRIIYSVAFEASSLQATPGKLALGLVVVNDDNVKPTLGQIIGRNTWGRFISYVIPLGIGLLMVFFRQDKKAMHDMLTSTQVCKKGPNKVQGYSEVFA